jgi:hypothetical protein
MTKVQIAAAFNATPISLEDAPQGNANDYIAAN